MVVGERAETVARRGVGTDLFDEAALAVGTGDGGLRGEVNEAGAVVAPIRRRSVLRVRIHVF